MHNGSVVKIYNTTSSVACFENRNIFLEKVIKQPIHTFMHLIIINVSFTLSNVAVPKMPVLYIVVIVVVAGEPIYETGSLDITDKTFSLSKKFNFSNLDFS
jgi:hypothetical protein